MMIECPRCGFAQPKDQYCASCGVNIDQYRAPTKPLWLRIIQNPNLHLSLIALLIAAVIGWIFYSQRALVGQEMGQLLDLPVSSRDAGDPEDKNITPTVTTAKAAVPAEATPPPADSNPLANEDTDSEKSADMDQAEATEAATPATVSANAADPATVAASGGPKTKLEVSFWEIPRDMILNALSTGEKVGDGNGGRALYWTQGSKFMETLQAQAQSVAPARNSPLNVGSQILIETPPTVAEAFQFLLQVEVVKLEGKDLTVRWESNLILPQNAEPGMTPPALIETTLIGSTALPPTGVLALVLEPGNRAPNEQYLTKAGPGPWNVLSSLEFRGGLTEWIVVVQLK